MKPRIKHLLIATAVVGVLGGTASAWAVGSHRGDCAGMKEGPRAERMQERMQARHSEHQAQLKAALQLTPAQESAWARYQQSHPRHGATASMGDRGQWEQLNTPERMEQMLAARKARDSEMAEHLAALKAFYATLTPEQQRTFDEQHRRGRGGMHGMRSHHS